MELVPSQKLLFLVFHYQIKVVVLNEVCMCVCVCVCVCVCMYVCMYAYVLPTFLCGESFRKNR